MVKENGMVMLTEKELEQIEREHKRNIEDYEKRLEIMQDAIKQLMKEGTPSTDIRVPKIDFLAIHQKALDEMFDIMEKPNGDELPNDIYGHDVTVHWHGIYCNCGDGAIVENNIIPGIEGVVDEDPTEY